MADANELLGRLAALVCEGEETHVEELREALAMCVEPAALDAITGPEGVAEWARVQAEEGHDTLWMHPSDAPRAAWELAQMGSPTQVCAVLAYPQGRALSDALCFETALLMETGVGELALVANTGALLEGSVEDVMEPLGCVLRTVYADEDADCCCDDDDCDCGCHEHGDDCDCGCHDHEHGEDCCCGEAEPPAVSVVLETGYLTPEQICRAGDLLGQGVDFVVAGTGYGPRDADANDVRLLCATVEPGVQVKAVAEASTLEEVLVLLEAGAARVVTPAAESVMADFDDLVARLAE